DRFRRASNETFVGQLAFDTGNLTFDFCHFFRQTRQLIVFVDETERRRAPLCRESILCWHIGYSRHHHPRGPFPVSMDWAYGIWL
ncbi:hypothetical protein MJL33_33040, partial [Salmonella enterica subsp. enterica serovar Kentucky]|nr:hypothetical protein [Salmonella enterica subsp. enterica serovar Kentucky]